MFDGILRQAAAPYATSARPLEMATTLRSCAVVRKLATPPSIQISAPKAGAKRAMKIRAGA